MKNTYTLTIRGNDVWQSEHRIDATNFVELASKVRVTLAAISKLTIEKLTVAKIQVHSMLVFED